MNSELQTDIIKTWPGFLQPRKVAQIFSEKLPPFHTYFFSLGRGKPQKPVAAIWFTYRGRILGRLPITEIVQNDGSLPKLNRLDGGESAWQMKDDVWVAVCRPPMRRVREHVFYPGFRGWRYFDFGQYRSTVDAKVRV